MKRLGIIMATALVSVGLAGCPKTSFDRATFDTLATTNGTLKAAQADYESGVLPKTACVYNLITKAKVAQGVAEQDFMAYYRVEEAKGDTAALSNTVLIDLQMIAPQVAAIKSIYTDPTSCK